jgi:hypothetical protein
MDSSALQATSPSNRSRVDAFGLAHRAQVEDLLRFRLRENENIHWAIEFGAGLDALGVELGDVVNFQHDAANYGLIGSRDAHYTGGGRVVAAQNNTVTIADIAGNNIGGHWPLDETAGTSISDMSEYANTGTLNGGDTAADKTIPGRFGGGAFRLNGVDDDITVALDSTLQWGTGDGTVCAWVRTSTIPAIAADMIVFCGDYGTSKYYRLDIQNATGLARFRMMDGSDAVSALSTTVITDGKWHFVAGIRDGNTARLYIDGVEENTGDATLVGDIDDATYGLTIGAMNNGAAGNGNNIEADIDEVHTYRRALSMPELLTVMYNGPRATIKIAGTLAFDDPDFEGGSTRYNMLLKSHDDVETIVPIIGYDPATREVAVIGPLSDLPEPDSLWAAGVENLQTKKFRITDGKVDEYMHPTLELTEYAAACYAGD